MNPEAFWSWATELVKGFSEAGTWLTTNLPVINLPPLAIIGFGGLTAFIAIAVVKWAVS